MTTNSPQPWRPQTMKIATILLAAALAVPAIAAPLAFPDRGRAAVVDAAHVLSNSQADALNRRIVAWDKATGHQLAVATIPSLQGHEIADYGYQLGRAWGLGRKGIDDGVVLIIAPVEHKVRIEVGRGLEGDLTDAQSAEILINTIVPRLKAHDLPGALSDGADAIMAAIPADAGDTANAAKASGSLMPAILGVIALMLAAGVGAWVLLERRRNKAVAESAARRRAREDGDAAKKRAAPLMPASYGRPPRYVSPLPPYGGSGASYEPPRAPVIAPVIVNAPAPTYEAPRRRDDDNSSSSSWGSTSDSSSSSSSSDSGSSSSGFDSGGGSFSGGGSDSSW
ncbi:TPM domain-containing protein [Sphingomonas abietis]|uniref:TPM domain-containing protein n=1 Tax=Sphingomonas abietis TaxID=3012344 RepID=A0ABY7NQZ8_9SPHN|nr:TPM domain-containing protein [Sphingomonas abietis]WBO23948.1 TPM domain-containing protein [Sphingomonas abietis]